MHYLPSTSLGCITDTLQRYNLEMTEPADECDPNLELTDKSIGNKRSTRTKTCPGCKTPHADHYWGPPHKGCEGNPPAMIPSDSEIKVGWPGKATMANKIMGSTNEKHKSKYHKSYLMTISMRSSEPYGKIEEP